MRKRSPIEPMHVSLRLVEESTMETVNALLAEAQTVLEQAEEFIQTVPYRFAPGQHTQDITFGIYGDRVSQAQTLRDQADRLDRQDAAAKAVRETRQRIRKHLGMRDGA